MKVVLIILSLFSIISCTNSSSPKTEERVVIETDLKNAKAVSKPQVLIKDQIDFGETDTVNSALLINLGLLQTYGISTAHQPYRLDGYFNGDTIPDIALLVKNRKNLKDGLLIIHGGENLYDFEILGAGSEVLLQNFDDLNWVGYFKKLNKGERVASNIDEKTGEIITYEIPDSLKTILKTDGIYIHAFESCGGGIIYWDNHKYNWIQQE